MRRHAWMLVLLTGAFVGCGSNSTDKKTVSKSSVTEPAVPAEVSQLFERGELAQAIDVLSSLIRKTPQDANLFSLRSMAHQRLGHQDDAIIDLDQAISLCDHDPKLYNNRGFIWLGMEKFDAALADFDKATELSPDYIKAFNNRGLLFIAKKRFIDAIAQFNRAIQIDNRYVDAYNNRGFAEFEAGQIEEALDDFNLALQLDPNYINAYNNRGLLRAHVGDLENSAVDFTRAMMLDPMNPKYYEHRCDVYEKQGFLDKAISDDNKITWLIEYHRLTKLIENPQLSAKELRSKQPPDYLTDRAKHWLLNDDQDKALADLERALSLNPRTAAALVVRAGIRFQQKSLAEAKADADASLSIEPTQEAYSILGDIYLKQKDYDRAIENYAHARRVDPNVAEAYYAKSKALGSQGQDELAKNHLEQALALDPGIVDRFR